MNVNKGGRSHKAGTIMKRRRVVHRLTGRFCVRNIVPVAGGTLLCKQLSSLCNSPACCDEGRVRFRARAHRHGKEGADYVGAIKTTR